MQVDLLLKEMQNVIIWYLKKSNIKNRKTPVNCLIRLKVMSEKRLLKFIKERERKISYYNRPKLSTDGYFNIRIPDDILKKIIKELEAEKCK